MARDGATHISVDVTVIQQLHVLPSFWARRSCRHSLQCGLVHTQKRPCRDFAMWTLNGGPFRCYICPLLLIHDAPVAPLLSPVCCRLDCLAISSSIFFPKAFPRRGFPSRGACQFLFRPGSRGKSSRVMSFQVGQSSQASQVNSSPL